VDVAPDQLTDHPERLIDSMATTPAYVRDTRMDILAANALSRELHAPVYRYAQHTDSAPNSARFAFLDPAGRDFYPDWDKVTHDCGAVLHAAAGRNPYDKLLSNLVGELSTRSETFRARDRRGRRPGSAGLARRDAPRRADRVGVVTRHVFAQSEQLTL